MSALSLGPLTIPIHYALLLLALVTALVVGRISARGRNVPISDTLFTLALAGILAARAVFVLRYWGQYASNPVSIIDIRDGGFDAIGGLLGMAAYASFVFHRRPSMRRPLGLAVPAGLLVWVVAGGILSLMQSGPMTRPEMPLARLAGDTTTLDELAAVKPDAPMVVNLWASWCPPCRTEMPMLVAAQQARPGVVFVFANQGEAPGTIRHFLQSEALAPHNVLVDSGQRLARAANAQAFPTTLFFAADGRLVDRHMGLLSRATLARALNRIDDTPMTTRPTAQETP
jgi:thiol-disulfide isomerase/thioredoxin